MLESDVALASPSRLGVIGQKRRGKREKKRESSVVAAGGDGRRPGAVFVFQAQRVSKP